MSDDVKNKPEEPAQEPQRCPCCNSYCSCPCHDATAAPSYPSELPASKLSWPQLPEPSARAVEAARRIIHFFRANPRVMRETVVGRIIDDVFESAPSQPTAREWLFELAWNGPNRVAHIVSWMEAYARQQTAAKDAEIADLRRQRDLEWDSRKAASSGRIAAERERDSLREALKKVKAKSENSLGLRVMVEINELTDAALKAGKDGQ